MDSIIAAHQRMGGASTLKKSGNKVMENTDKKVDAATYVKDDVNDVNDANDANDNPAALYCIEELAVDANVSSGKLDEPITSQFQQKQRNSKPVEPPKPLEENPVTNSVSQQEVQEVQSAVSEPKKALIENECIKASVCPKSHKFNKCVELSTDDSLCNILEIKRDKKKAKLGRPGRYSSASQAISEQERNIAPRSVIVGSSLASSSALVRLVPAESSLPIVATIKIVEFLLLLYLGTKSPLPMSWRIVVIMYFLALLHFHLKQATSSKKRSDSDAVFEHFGMRELEKIEMVSQDTILVFHDGGKNTEFQVYLKKIKECKGVPHACIEYECCNFNKDYD